MCNLLSDCDQLFNPVFAGDCLRRAARLSLPR